ncbi:MAG TPA: ABC transporter ATP-binding protein [Desulfomonilaceae bacterium]|nr:ABC transporter ATP-binding protein [Desulfomonilaceae bacterium]
MLEIQNLHVSYGGIRALKGITLRVEERWIVSLLGSNGAGKSTTIRAVSGLVPIASGLVQFRGRAINNMPVHEIQKLGLVHVPEGRKIFANLTVRENLLMGAYNNRRKEDVDRTMERVLSIFQPLESRLDQLGGTLSGGEQQMLAISRALMSGPKLLMMDEPSLGLAPLVTAEVFRVIQEIRQEGVTIFLVEQNANAALKIADYALILETGRVVLEGPGNELLNNPEVKRAYLGETRQESMPS